MNENWTSPTPPPSDGSASAATLQELALNLARSYLHTVPWSLKTQPGEAGEQGAECRYEKLELGGLQRNLFCFITRVGGQLSPWLFFNVLFSPSFRGVQMWNTTEDHCYLVSQACLCFAESDAFCRSASPWVACFCSVFSLDFTRFGSIPRCAEKDIEGSTSSKWKEMYLAQSCCRPRYPYHSGSAFTATLGVWCVWLNFHWSVKMLQIPLCLLAKQNESLNCKHFLPPSSSPSQTAKDKAHFTNVYHSIVSQGFNVPKPFTHCTVIF